MYAINREQDVSVRRPSSADRTKLHDTEPSIYAIHVLIIGNDVIKKLQR